MPTLARRLERPSLDEPVSSLVVLDLDHFKAVNDLHGHAAGDQVLRGVAQAMQATLRRNDSCLRWGGEEFLLVLQGAHADEALGVMEGLRRRLAALQHALPDGPVVQVTASLGITALQVGERLEAAIARADRALYTAKRQGRNRVVVT